MANANTSEHEHASVRTVRRQCTCVCVIVAILVFVTTTYHHQHSQIWTTSQVAWCMKLCALQNKSKSYDCLHGGVLAIVTLQLASILSIAAVFVHSVLLASVIFTFLYL